MNVLDFAVQIGERGKTYFASMADDSNVPGVTFTLRSIASERQEFSRKFAAMKRQVGSTANLGSPRLDRMKNRFYRIFDRAPVPLLRKNVDAYRHALYIEKGVLRFVEKAVRRERNEEARRALMVVAQEELKLYTELESMRDFLQSSRWYPNSIEFAMLVDSRGAFPLS